MGRWAQAQRRGAEANANQLRWLPGISSTPALDVYAEHEGTSPPLYEAPPVDYVRAELWQWDSEAYQLLDSAEFKWANWGTWHTGVTPQPGEMFRARVQGYHAGKALGWSDWAEHNEPA